MIKISIVIPCFNGGKYLKNTIIKLLSTNNNFEIIIVDDCSTDDSYQILQQFTSYENIHLYRNEINKGVSFSRNKGLSYAQGKYILFLDSDDHLRYDFFDKINTVLNKGDFDIISFGYQIQNQNKVINYGNIKFNNQFFKSEDFLKLYFERAILQCMCSFICKREVIIANTIQFDINTFYAEDQEFQIRCMLKSKEIYYLSDELFIYNFHDNNTMSNKFSDKRLTSLDAFKRLNVLIPNESVLYKYFINYLLFNYYGLVKLMLKSNINLSVVKKYCLNIKLIEELKPFLIFNRIGVIVNVLFFLEKQAPKIFSRILKSSN